MRLVPLDVLVLLAELSLPLQQVFPTWLVLTLVVAERFEALQVAGDQLS